MKSGYALAARDMRLLLTAMFATALACLSPGARAQEFSFGVIGQTVSAAGDDEGLARAIADSDADNLAFVVLEGFKRDDEACTDALYQRRLDLLSTAKNGLIVSPAGADWAECRNANGRSAAVERLTRLRELFYLDDFSHGASKIPLLRQSGTPKFRAYVENARWEIGNVLFATVNLPADNNHYRTEAGRNSEFEDRMIADRNWLQHIFASATYRKMSGIVLFCDGNPLDKPPVQHIFGSSAKRDGFAEIRQQLTTLSAKFHGRVLVVHKQSERRTAAIAWQGNLGDIGPDGDWIKLNVKPGSPALFSVGSRSPAQ